MEINITIKYSNDNKEYKFNNLEDYLNIKNKNDIIYLNCSGNELPNLDILKLNDFPNLQILDCSCNNLTILGELNLPNLQELYCNNNNLTTLGELNLPNLQVLWCQNNNLTTLGELNLPNLQVLYCSYNELTTLGKLNLPNLQRLWCRNNNLTTLRELNLPNLQKLSCSHNNLTTLGELNFPNLQILWCENNNLTTLPLNIINLNLTYYNIEEGNELDIVNPRIRRWLHNLRARNGFNNKSNIYNDSQNVHNSDINEGIKKAIEWIINRQINPVRENIHQQIINNQKINKDVKDLLFTYLEDINIHSVMNVTFADIFYMSYDLIEEKELEGILNEEMLDGECYCFTGRLNRYVNIFNGSIDECSFQLHDSSVFGALFSHLVAKYNRNRTEIERELKERGYKLEDLTDWLNELE